MGDQKTKSLSGYIRGEADSSKVDFHLKLLLRQIESVSAAAQLVDITFRNYDIAMDFIANYSLAAFVDEEEILPFRQVKDILLCNPTKSSGYVTVVMPLHLPTGKELTLLIGRSGETVVDSWQTIID